MYSAKQVIFINNIIFHYVLTNYYPLCFIKNKCKGCSFYAPEIQS